MGKKDELQDIIFKSEMNDAIRLCFKKQGYFVDNLWHLNDVSDRFDCTDDEAYEVLTKVLQSDYIMESIHEAICQVAQDEFNLKFRNDG